MITFIKQLFGFLIFPVVIYFAIEFYLLNYPSAFQLKAKFLKNHNNEIEVLVLGSSHNQMAVNPSFMTSKKVSNIAFAGQDLGLDYKLMTKVIPKLPNLKVVILEMSYHTLEHINEEFERNSLYLWCYGIQNSGFTLDIRNYSVLMAQPNLYKKLLNPFTKKPTVNEFGFTTSLSTLDKGTLRFKELHYDTNLIAKDTGNIFIQRHQYEDLTAYASNSIVFSRMLELCHQRNLKVVVISPPVYTTYSNTMTAKKRDRRNSFIRAVTSKNPEITFHNFENDPRFQVRDFMNEDHLNPDGAEKFSKILDQILSAHVSSH